MAGRGSLSNSPGSVSYPHSSYEDGKPYSEQLRFVFYLLVYTLHTIISLLYSFTLFSPSNSRNNLSVCTKLEFDGSSDSLNETDCTPKSHLPSHWRSNKKSTFSKEQDLQNLLRKLSVHSIEIPYTPSSGDTDSLSSSHASGE